MVKMADTRGSEATETLFRVELPRLDRKLSVFDKLGSKGRISCIHTSSENVQHWTQIVDIWDINQCL